MSAKGATTSIGFGASVARGGAAMDSSVPITPIAAAMPDADALVDGVRRADRAALGRCISLVESTHPAHERLAQRVLERLHVLAGNAVRVGITGVPGSGKSTFIERLGLVLCERGRKVAVLAIDPSSTITGGSVLGDRTRMGGLASHSSAFVRPSPSSGTLGGVARRTREAMLVCEAAGFDVVLIETVGVGQSEVSVSDMCDCLVALGVAGTGDGLQGIKRGLLELVDVIAINKADGENEAKAKIAARELAASMHLSRGGGEDAAVLSCSAKTGSGVEAVWKAVERRVDGLRANGVLAERRREQDRRWLDALVQDGLRRALETSSAARDALASAREQVGNGAVLASVAAERVIATLLASGTLTEKTMGDVNSRTGRNATPISALGVNHIGIAVRSLDAQRGFYEGVLGARFEGVEEVPEQKVRVAFYALGAVDRPVRLELLEPTAPDSPIAVFIEKKGEGLHHVAYSVESIEERLAALKSAGVRMIDERARDGAHGAKIAFVHPKASMGVLTELCEPRAH